VNIGKIGEQVQPRRLSEDAGRVHVLEIGCSFPFRPEEPIMRRVVAVVLVSCVLPSLCAQEKKQEPPTVTAEELPTYPERHDGKVVRMEGVLESDPRETVYMGMARYNLGLGEDGIISIVSGFKPGVSKGDRVRLTGKYTYERNSFVPYRLLVEAPDGKIENFAKEPIDVTGKDLGEQRKQLLGKMVRLEFIVPDRELTRADDGKRYLELGKEDPVRLVIPEGTSLKVGDRMAITGQFDYRAPTFARLRINAGCRAGRSRRSRQRKKRRSPDKLIQVEVNRVGQGRVLRQFVEPRPQ